MLTEPVVQSMTASFPLFLVASASSSQESGLRSAVTGRLPVSEQLLAFDVHETHVPMPYVACNMTAIGAATAPVVALTLYAPLSLVSGADIRGAF